MEHLIQISGKSYKIFPHSCEIEAVTDIPTRCKLEATDKVNMENFLLRDYLGRGAFGEVYLVQKKTGVDSGKLYAMKILKRRSAFISNKRAEHMACERLALERVGTEFPFIAGLHYAFKTDNELFLILDYVKGGSLTTLLRKHHRVKEYKAKVYVAQMVLALEYLHNLGIIHRDLKPDNILFENEYLVRIIDFGIAKLMKPGCSESNYTYCGSGSYMPPETFLPSGPGHNAARDWWAVGILTYMLLTGQHPFKKIFSRKNSKSMPEIIAAWSPCNIPKELSAEARDFITQLLEKDPLKRLGTIGGAANVKEHPFFSGVDWNSLYDAAKTACLSIQNVEPLADRHLTRRRQPSLSNASYRNELEFNTFNRFTFVAAKYLRKELVESDEYTVDQYEYCNLPVLNPQPFPADLSLICKLKGGSFGATFLIKKKTSPPKIYFLKVLDYKNYRPSEVDALTSLSRIDQSFICGYVDTYRYLNNIMIMMEYIEGPNLYASGLDGYSEEKCQHIFAQIVKGLNYIHNCGFVHGDIKPLNIVFTDITCTNIKIVDFGFTTYSSNLEYWYDRPRYSVSYAPPEAWQHKRYAIYSKAYDIWSLGATLYCMFMGHGPFIKDRNEPHFNMKVIKKRITNLEITMRTPRWVEASAALRNVILRCMRFNRTARIKLDDLMKHAFLKDQMQRLQ